MTACDDDPTLIARAASGDSEAFVALCESHRERLWRVISSVAAPADRDDLAQEAIIRAFRSLNTFRREAPFAVWLCRIAVNTAHDYRKSAWKRRVVRLLDLAESEAPRSDAPQDLVERREMQLQVRQAVSDLSEPQRVAIWLVYFEGFTIAATARLEQTSESTIRSRLLAGYKRLACPLRPLLADYEQSAGSSNAKGCEI